MDILCEPPFSLPSTFDAVDDAIDANADISEAILASGLSMFGPYIEGDTWKGTATPEDMDKARSTIRQLYRDWSQEGASERHAAFSAIHAALEAHIPRNLTTKRHDLRIVVPGAGLARLVFELCAAGFTVEGNEVSRHQLITSHYVLNCINSVGQHRLYPWALAFNNHVTRANQLESVLIPDVLPSALASLGVSSSASEIPSVERMSMTAGDFCRVYQRPQEQARFDAMVSCFFLDTARNVFTYIETVKNCLKPGGLWINVGPLLWHFDAASTPADEKRNSIPGDEHRGSDLREFGSFELSDDEVVALIERLGFDIVEHQQAPGGTVGYIQDPASMLQNMYRPSFWIARKK